MFCLMAERGFSRHSPYRAFQSLAQQMQFTRKYDRLWRYICRGLVTYSSRFVHIAQLPTTCCGRNRSREGKADSA